MTELPFLSQRVGQAGQPLDAFDHKNAAFDHKNAAFDHKNAWWAMRDTAREALGIGGP